MNKFLLIGVTACLSAAVLSAQHLRRQLLLVENEQAAAALVELEARAKESASACQTAELRATDLQRQLNAGKASLDAAAATPAPPPEPSKPAPPDPARQGGWPLGAGYIYLPKQYLTNASYKLFNGGQLTDETAALLGMSPRERATVNQSIGDVLAQFRALELKNMVAVPQPEGWAGLAGLIGGTDQKALTYQIPSLATEAQAMYQSLLQQLDQTLGAARAQLVESAADSYLRHNLDDLGANQRTIGFVQTTEPDGSYSLWYGVADAAHGEGSFQRVPEDLDPNSQTAYYAGLLGVKLPGK